VNEIGGPPPKASRDSTARDIATALLDAIPLMKRWGVSVRELVAGEAVTLVMEPANETVGPYGRVLGGVLLMVADIAAALCAALAWRATVSNDDIVGFSTQSLACEFLGSAPGAEAIRFEATVVRVSTRRAVVMVSAVSADRKEYLRILAAIACQRSTPS
jgi:acyl-coenzyme A thioesterase PaaI-like protein